MSIGRRGFLRAAAAIAGAVPVASACKQVGASAPKPVQTFTSTGTWQKPKNRVWFECWGSGGSGSYAGGGGQGCTFDVVSSEVTVTVGKGGRGSA